MGGGQQQETPRHADTVLQTSLECLDKKNRSTNLYHIYPIEKLAAHEGAFYRILPSDVAISVMCNCSNIFYL